jgi:hypoxanthine phosphoribosyltransferase
MRAVSEILLDRSSIQKRVEELGFQISKELSGSDLCVMPVMDGGMIFTADLVREIQLPLMVIPIKASSYGDATASSGSVSLPLERIFSWSMISSTPV